MPQTTGFYAAVNCTDVHSNREPRGGGGSPQNSLQSAAMRSVKVWRAHLCSPLCAPRWPGRVSRHLAVVICEGVCTQVGARESGAQRDFIVRLLTLFITEPCQR